MSDSRGSEGSGGRRQPLLIALLALLAVESLLILGALVWLLVELLTTEPTSLSTAIAIIVLVAAALLGAIVATVHLARGRAWARSAVLVWQGLQIAIAVGSFQGALDEARPDIGSALLIPAVLVVVLLFTKPVVAATSRRDG